MVRQVELDDNWIVQILILVLFYESFVIWDKIVIFFVLVFMYIK